MPNSSLVRSYATPPAPGNPRATEAWALTRLALRLRDSKERADAADILEAVRVNWRLWTILQADLLGQECQLPDDLRGSLLSLAHFIDKHTVDIIADPKPEKLDVLISINRELAGGLFTTPSRGGDGAGEGNGDGTGDRAVAVSA